MLGQALITQGIAVLGQLIAGVTARWQVPPRYAIMAQKPAHNRSDVRRVTAIGLAVLVVVLVGVIAGFHRPQAAEKTSSMACPA
jgi:putative copper export protein